MEQNEKEEFKLDVVSIRLVHDAPLMSGTPISSPEDAVRLVGKELCEMDREVVCVINLKSNQVPINCSFIGIGSLNNALIHPREMLKAAFLSNASNMIMVHNHPSGCLDPSTEDTIITDRMIKICKLAEIPLIDHIIVGGDNTRYFSYLENGILDYKGQKEIFETCYNKIQFQDTAAAENETVPNLKRRGR